MTYPRTDSSFLSDDMEQTAANIIEVIWEVFAFPERLVCCPDIKRVLNSKKVTDHHAIIPTMELANVDLAALPDKEKFMERIEKMVSELVHLYQEAYEEKKSVSVQEQNVLGVCPNCGGQVLKGRYGAYCKERCGMNVGRVMGVVLTEEQVKELLEGKKVLLKRLKSKAGKEYDAFVVPDGIEEFSYQKDEEEKRGVQFKVVMEFPKKNELK